MEEFFAATHLCHSGWHLSAGFLADARLCFDGPNFRSRRQHAFTPHRIRFPSLLQLFFLNQCWLSFDLAIWAHFLKFLEKRGSMKIKWYWTDPATLSTLAPKAILLSCIQFMTFAMNISSLLVPCHANNQIERRSRGSKKQRQLVKTIDAIGDNRFMRSR